MLSSQSETKEFLRDYGMKQLFLRRSYYREDSKESFDNFVKSQVIESESLFSNSLSKAILEDDVEYLKSILDFAKDNSLKIENNSFWRSSLDKIVNSFPTSSDGEIDASFLLQGRARHILMAAERIEGFNWEDLFLKVYPTQKLYGYIRNEFVTVLDMYSKTATSSFEKFANNDIFFSKTKPGYHIRGLIYSSYVKRGLLNSKTARKIRSDASGEASTRGLKALMDNPDLYENHDDLLLQFTDSKHEEVVVYLAKNLPMYLVSSLMGTEFYHAKRVLERRLQAEEEQR